MVSTFEAPRTLNVERIRVLMESEDDMGLDAVRKAITYYQSCITGDTRDTSVQAVRDLIQNRLGIYTQLKV